MLARQTRFSLNNKYFNWKFIIMKLIIIIMKLIIMNPKRFAIKQWENLKLKFNHQMLINDLNKFERFCVDYYMISSSSFKDCYSGVKPSWQRVIKSWLCVAYIWFMTGLFAFLAYRDDRTLYFTFGIPFPLFINSSRETCICLAACFSIGMIRIILSNKLEG